METLYLPIAMATQIRHGEASCGKDNTGNRMRAGMQKRRAG